MRPLLLAASIALALAGPATAQTSQQILPINTTGLLLIVFGIGLLILELKVPGGVLGVGGTVALIVGAVMMTGTVPGVSVGLTFIVPVAVAFAGIFLFLGRLALRAHRQPAVTGAEGLIGADGEAVDPITPDRPGYVRVHGERWRAASGVPVASGQSIRVLNIKGLTLTVEPLVSTRQGERS